MRLNHKFCHSGAPLAGFWEPGAVHMQQEGVGWCSYRALHPVYVRPCSLRGGPHG